MAYLKVATAVTLGVYT